MRLCSCLVSRENYVHCHFLSNNRTSIWTNNSTSGIYSQIQKYPLFKTWFLDKSNRRQIPQSNPWKSQRKNTFSWEFYMKPHSCQNRRAQIKNFQTCKFSKQRICNTSLLTHLPDLKIAPMREFTKKMNWKSQTHSGLAITFRTQSKWIHRAPCFKCIKNFKNDTW